MPHGKRQSKPDRDQFLDCVRRIAAKDRYGLAEPDVVAAELGIDGSR
jgi:hypothetical protein